MAGQNKLIKAYPNPVSNELTIEIEGNTNDTYYEILNSIGQVVFKGNMTDKAVVQTSGFNAGIYLLKIETSRDVYEIKKIIKE